MTDQATETQSPQHELSELVQAYSDGESVDKELFAEQRSNILLIAGDHYTKSSSKYWNRIRDSKDIAQEQKIRLVQNHIYKIMRNYANSIVSFAPSVTCQPEDEKDLAHQKSAEIHNHILDFAKKKYRFKEKVRDWADDFVGIGEVCTKVFFDPNKGQPVGYEQAIDDQGQPQINEMGEPVASDKLIFSGDFVFETFYGFDLLRDARAKSMADSPFITLRKMVNTKDMKDRYEGDPEKQKCFQDSADGTYLVFDSNRAAYSRTKDMCLIKETYYRPCQQYPKGYYYYWTAEGIFEQGELPLGIWPLAFAPFDKYQTSPRGRSHIKVLRPYQAEINRSASKMAEHQITLGDDKVITQAGTTIKQGGILPGVRGITVSGPAPVILPGRDGSQYLGYMNSKITEMWNASLIQEEMTDKQPQSDPYGMLFQAASQKKKFSVYTERFEQFLVDVVTIFFDLARHYMPDNDLKAAIGVNDLANIDQFKSPEKLNYLIQIEPQTDDIESKFGKQLVMNHFIQFAGSAMDKEDLGKLMRESPYVNSEEMFSDLTSNFDAGTNAILALERGKQPMSHSFDDHPYFIKRYLSRMRKPDFDTLSPQIQAAFQQAVSFHEQQEAQKQAQLKAAEADFIPTGGALVVCDLYVPDPKNPESSKRARLPYEALDWLIKRLEDQGSSQQALSILPTSASTDIMSQAAGMPGPSINPAKQMHPGMPQMPQQVHPGVPPHMVQRA